MRALGLGRIWGGAPLYRRNGIEVRERGGLRTLHLGSDIVQSAMRIDKPDALELSYTRAMMGFLLFRPPPRRLTLIGLGGGSLAKFVYHHMPETRSTAIELDAGVIEVARIYFGLPDECSRLRLVVGDGSQYVETAKSEADVLLVDAYDGETLAASLATETFYQAARRALAPRGVFAMNLWSNDRLFDRNLRRIEHAFDGACLCLPAERPGNVVVLAFETLPYAQHFRWSHLYEHAKLLERRFGLEFSAFVSGLRRMNSCDDTGLTLAER